MRIAIEASRIVIPKLSGVGGAALSVMPYLVDLAIKKGHTVDLLAQKGQKAPFTIPKGARWVTLPNPLGGAWTQTSLAYSLWQNKYDVAFFPASPIPFLSLGKMVATIHDVAFLHEPEVYPAKERLLLLSTTRFTVFQAAKIIVPTKKVADDLVAWQKESEKKIEIIAHGVDHQKYLPKEKMGEKFLLHVGRVETKKATQELIIMLKKIHNSGWRVPLVFVGSFGYNGDQTIEACKREGLKFAVSAYSSWPGILSEADVIFLDYVPEAELKKIFTEAFALVNLSPNEGFGLPVLEAMATKTPVVVCAGTATAEVNKDSRCWVEKHSPAQAADLLLSWHKNPNLAWEIADKGFLESQKFSWAESAAAKLEVLEQAAIS